MGSAWQFLRGDAQDAVQVSPKPAPAEAGANRDIPLRIGDRVRVRRQRWRIVDLRAFGECQVLALAGIGVSNSGTVRRVILPFDVVERLNHDGRLKLVTLPRWRRACRSLLAAHGTAAALRRAAGAKIELLPHQLEPALALVRGLGTRVLIADQVGLGKTIQAGLVVAELQARGAVDRVLLLTPSSLREQWTAELGRRFGIDAAILDLHEARRRRADLPIGVNPWSTQPIAIASIDYVKRPEVPPAVRACRWDLIVIDEAHDATPGSDRYEAIKTLCSMAPYVMLLTATPHNGDHRSFASLCNLGARDDQILVFRRSRSALALSVRRRVHRLLIRPSVTERHMHAALAHVTRAVHAERCDLDSNVWLTLTTLRKRALSSAYSLERSITRACDLLPEGVNAGQQFSLPLDDADDLVCADDSPPLFAPLFEDHVRDRETLIGLADAARAVGSHETKLVRLRTLLTRLDQLKEPAIVFTEYRDTLLHVRDVLSRDCAMIHGGMNRAQRQAAVNDFTSGRRSLLLSTDAASEGLNLHHTCRVVINLELPWNPMRLEQRIGRVDRIGQTRTVHAFHLIARETDETRILERLQQRIAEAQATIGAADPLGLSGADVEPSTQVNSSVVTSRDPDMSPVNPNRITLTNLEDDAAAEHARLTVVRSLAAAWQPAPWSAAAGVGRLTTFCRRRGLRVLLSSRTLALVQTDLEDVFGRAVATHLSALALPPTHAISRSALEGLLQTLDHATLERIDPEFTLWREESCRCHAGFWATRAARERAIAGLGDDHPPSPFQAGLFDRRANYQHAAKADVEKVLGEEAARRIASAEAAGATDVRTTAVIFLVPRVT